MINEDNKSQIIELKKNISGKNVVLKCEDFLKSQGEWLLDLFEKEAANEIKDDFKIQVGFNMFIFKKQENYFKVIMPDYAKDPFKDTIDNISIALILQFQLNETVKKLDVNYEEIVFDDELRILSKARNADNIYIERAKEYNKGQSGWYIGAFEMAEDMPKSIAGQVESVPVCSILKFRPDLLKLLSLPKGYIVTIIHNEIVEIMDGNSQLVYKKMN